MKITDNPLINKHNLILKNKKLNWSIIICEKKLEILDY